MLRDSISTGDMLRLRDLLVEHPGEVPVTLNLKLPGRTFRITTQETYKVELCPDLAASLEQLLGQGSVRERYLAVG